MEESKVFTAETLLPPPPTVGTVPGRQGGRRGRSNREGGLEEENDSELLQARSSCGMGFNSPIRQCKAPLSKAGRQAWLRVNPCLPAGRSSRPRPLVRQAHHPELSRGVRRGVERVTSCTFQNPLDSCPRSKTSVRHRLPGGSTPKLPSVLLTR